MRTIFDPAAADALDRRLRSLSPASRGLWGRMTVQQMICHVGDQMRCGLGELPTRRRKNLLSNSALRFLFVHLLPWPRGRVPTVPEMQTTQSSSWDPDLESTLDALRRAAARGPNGEWAIHPAFGPLSGREWGWLIHKHLDHHLRQFGA